MDTCMLMVEGAILSGIRAWIRFPWDIETRCIHGISCISYIRHIVDVRCISQDG